MHTEDDKQKKKKIIVALVYAFRFLLVSNRKTAALADRRTGVGLWLPNFPCYF